MKFHAYQVKISFHKYLKVLQTLEFKKMKLAKIICNYEKFNNNNKVFTD